MRILIVRNVPTYMNVRNNTYNIQEVGLAKALRKQGYLADILFWTDKEEEQVAIQVNENHRLIIHYRHGRSFLKNTVFTGCDDLFNEYDVLQFCEYNQIQCWLMAKKYPQKTIIYHGPYYSAFNRRYNLMSRVFDMFFLKRYLKLNTPFIVKSDLALAYLKSKGITNVYTVGVGMDVEMLGNSETNDFIEQMKNSSSHIKLLYIGRIEKRRNPQFLLKVLHVLKQRGIDAKLFVIGNGNKDDLEGMLNLCDQLDLRQQFSYCASMEQRYLSSVYRHADVFLLPTSYEIFGMVLLEAMYYELAVVTTHNGGSSILIEHQKTGWIEDQLNEEKWADAIEKIHSDEKMKASAHETIASGYTWDKLAEQFVLQYKKLKGLRKENLWQKRN